MSELVKQVRMRAFMAKELLRLVWGVWTDLRRYVRYSSTGFARNRPDVGQLEGRLIAACHVLEKGLSMPECRPGFGIAAVQGLFECMRKFDLLGGKLNSPAFKSALAAFESYLAKQKEFGIDIDSGIPPEMRATLNRWKTECGDRLSSVLECDRASFFELADAPFAPFCASRHSCRHFDPTQPVEIQKISEAVKIALHTPSSCNRQPWRVYAVTSKPLVERCLGLHAGSRGFQHLIPALLIVTARTDVYSGPAEYAQCFIDGGMFAMSLIYALHHLRIGCVALNWSVAPKTDRQLREIVGINSAETVILLLGIGHPAERFTVPRSLRREVEEVLVFVESR